MKLILAALLPAYALTLSASAQSTPVSQTRTTRVFTTTHTAPDFALFNDTNASGSPGSPTYQTAVQNSSMTPSSIHMDVHFTWATTGPTVHNIDTESRFSYTFDVPAYTYYRLTGQSRPMQGIGNGTSYAQLTGPAGIYFTCDGNAPVPLPFGFTGILGPGRYTLIGRSETTGSTQGSGFSGQGGIDITLTLYCPADFNRDGITDFFDYLDFVDDFSANSPAADFNRDSVIDFFDYLDFVDAFSSGC